MTPPLDSPLIIDVGAGRPVGFGPTFGPFDVSDWWGIHLYVKVSSGAVSLRFAWGWTEEFGGSFAFEDAGERTFDLVFGGSNPLRQIVVPHLGPWLAIYALAVPSGGWSSVRAVHTNRRSLDLPVPAMSGGHMPGILADTAGMPAVVAGSPQTILLPSWSGPAHAWAWSDSTHANTLVSITGEDYDGARLVTIAELWRGDAPDAQKAPRQLWLPPLVNKLKVVSGESAARTFVATITPGR